MQQDHRRMPTSARRIIRGFTLIELLVVVAIIALLIAILLPSLQRARAVAQAVACRMQQRQVAIAFFMFANEHNQKLPGGLWWRWSKLTPSEAQPWYGAEVGEKAHNVFGWNHTGILAPYIGLDIPVGQVRPTEFTNIYRCPGEAAGKFNSGIGSNGFFDYSSPGQWAGAIYTSVRLNAQVRDPATGFWSHAATPLLIEENPAQYINNFNIEMTTGNLDSLGAWHPDHTSNVAAFDGSVNALTFTSDAGPTMFDWSVIAPSGREIDLTSNPGYGYGSWNTR